ncbi:MAG: putrescine/ornithine APC transporter [Candidatus Hepatoplasma vulgare]|nr:MAG: putrescine/ornithine APC transporter [Candidatus Hepatoplasma sp.]
MVNVIKNEDTENRSRYGLISMIAIVIGTVIGSGIYVKNSSLYETTNSAIYVTIGWIIGGLIVISMFIAFIEIMSITTKKNEQGTFANWGRHLWGEKTSKYIGIYFIFFYFPFVISVETIFSSNYLNNLTFGDASTNVVGSFFFITFFAFIFLIFTYFLNIFFLKTSRVMQVTGTVIKTIPLFAVIFLMIIIVAGVIVGDSSTATNEIFNPDDPINSNHKGVASIFLIIPAILFTLDGFLFSASISKEAKKPQTFKNAAIIAIIFIIIIYTLFSLSSLYLGGYDSTDSSGFAIEGVINNIFSDNVASVLVTVTDVILIISILVATFGYVVSATYSLSDASNFDDIKDEKGLYLRRSVDGVPYNAGMKLLTISFLFVFIMRFFDGTALIFIDDKVEATGYIGMSDFASNLFTITNFFIYSILILGAFRNRWTKKIETDKVRGFFVFSIISMVLVWLVVITSIYQIFDSFFDPNVEIYKTVYHILIIVLFVLLIIIISEKIIKKSETLTKKQIKYKQNFKNAYDQHLELNHYLRKNNIKIKVDKKYYGEKINSSINKWKNWFKKKK